MSLLLPALLTALGAVVVLWKLKAHRLRFLEVPLDLAFTGLLTFKFWGTFSGMLTAALAGLFFSVIYRALVRWG